MHEIRGENEKKGGVKVEKKFTCLIFMGLQIFHEKKSFLDVKLNAKTYFINEILSISF